MSDLADAARKIIDSSIYLTLGTTGADGTPWVTPVFFATADYHDFYWMSSPLTDHSRNLEHQPRVGIVIYDTSAPAFEGNGVWISGRAEQVPDADLPDALAIYPGGPERGGNTMKIEQVKAPSQYRIYRARADRYWTLCPRETGPCEPHGKAFDHRIEIEI